MSLIADRSQWGATMEMGDLDASATTLVLRTSKHRGAMMQCCASGPKEETVRNRDMVLYRGFPFEVVCKTKDHQRSSKIIKDPSSAPWKTSGITFGPAVAAPKEADFSTDAHCATGFASHASLSGYVSGQVPNGLFKMAPAVATSCNLFFVAWTRLRWFADRTLRIPIAVGETEGAFQSFP